MAWFFLLIVLTPLGQLEVEVIGPFTTQADCKTIEKVIVMKFPQSYLLVETITCWKGGKENAK